MSWYESRELEPPFWELPKEVSRPKSLKALIISDLDLRTLPPSIADLTDLQLLDISFNKMDLENELDELKELKKLERIIAYGNHFSEEWMKEFQLKYPHLRIDYKSEQ